MTKATSRVLAGVAVAVLAAAGVTVAMRYRQGHRPQPADQDHLDELEARLDEAEAPDKDAHRTHVGRVLADLDRNHGISVARLRRWIAGLRHGTLSSEQATIAESDFDALEREADQRGA